MLWQVRVVVRTNARRRTFTAAQHDAVWEAIREFGASYDWEAAAGVMSFTLTIDPMHLTPPHFAGGQAQFTIQVAFETIKSALARAGVALQQVEKVEAAPVYA